MEFSGYLTGNRAADADRDKDGEAYYCCCYLVCLKPAMDFISPFFRVQHFNQNNQKTPPNWSTYIMI